MSDVQERDGPMFEKVEWAIDAASSSDEETELITPLSMYWTLNASFVF